MQTLRDSFKMCKDPLDSREVGSLRVELSVRHTDQLIVLTTRRYLTDLR